MDDGYRTLCIGRRNVKVGDCLDLNNNEMVWACSVCGHVNLDVLDGDVSCERCGEFFYDDSEEHDPEKCGCEYRGMAMWSCGHVDGESET